MSTVANIFIKMLLHFLIIVCALQVGFATMNFEPMNSAEILRKTEIRRVQYQPRHLHIAYGDDPFDMVVTWSTIDYPNASIVEYGIDNIGEYRKDGFATKLVSQGPLGLTQYIHRVTLTRLRPGGIYVYHVGSDFGWSNLFSFKVMHAGFKWSPQLAIFGDLGNDNPVSLTRLQEEVQKQYYDAILHVGDFAYNMEEENGQIGDSFMDQIEPVAAYVPYMTCPGNHEQSMNFLQYKNRFSMPGNSSSMFYSWNMGPIHFISISTEFYYYLQYGLKPVAQQYEWLLTDLREATTPKNRSLRPWIITYGHRPMYCSNEHGGDCTVEESRVRVGLPYTHWYGLEDLFMEYGVDLTIWAHEHSYERLWPMYNRTVYNGTIEPYTNPRALVHIITGSAGCWSKHDPFGPNQPTWSAFRTTDYGYSRLKVVNSTHLYMDQVSIDQDGKVIDSFWLVRDKHGPYDYPKYEY